MKIYRACWISIFQQKKIMKTHINIYIIGPILWIVIILSGLVFLDLSKAIFSNQKQVEVIRVKHDIPFTLQETLSNLTITSQETQPQLKVLKKLPSQRPYVIYLLGFSYNQ